MKTQKIFLFISILAAMSLALSACGSKEPDVPTPTPVDANAIAVQAIQTFSMQLTMTAFAQPTATLTPPPPTVAPTFILLGTSSPAVAPTSSADVSVWIRDLTYDDTAAPPVLHPGEQFVKKWLVQNGGTKTWTPNYKVAFAGIGVPLGGQPTLLGKTVGPGEQVEVSVSFIAPTVAGDYKSFWKLQTEAGQWFGTYLTATIKVVGATVTPSEEPIATP